MSYSQSPLPAPPPKAWWFRPCDQARADLLSRDLGLAPLAARLLTVREIHSVADAREFLAPSLTTLHDPATLPDIGRAVERIVQAIEQGEPIAVWGDYDVDGLTSSALLVRFFRWMGVEVATHIPNRLTEGYGMSRGGIDRLREKGARLIVTVDNGISSLEEIAYAASLGIDVVVTDHHEPESELPGAVAVVNPNRADSAYPFRSLCGCGVAFKLAHALARRLEVAPERAKPFLVSMLDLVALATVADVMPLLGENRVLVHYGLQELSRTSKPGLKAMAEMLGTAERPMTSETVAYLFAPRLNAAGRTGNPEDGLELLLTEDETRSWELAKYLDTANQQRRSIENDVLDEALDMLRETPRLLDDPVLVLAGAGWHQGVVGIVASRLLERFGRPTIVMGIEGGEAKGSARSFDGFDIRDALGRTSDILSRFGGHKMAAGVALDAGDVGAFREALNRHVAGAQGGAPQAPRLALDAAAAPEEMTLDMLGQLDRLRPFGQGNPAPTIALMACVQARASQNLGGKHLKLFVKSASAPGSGGPGLAALWFHYPEPHEPLRALIDSGRPIDIAGSPKVNHWNGVDSVQFTIKDIRPHAE